jgi:flagellar L-ring protein precursor FlgH
MKKIVLSLSMVILTAAFYGCATVEEIPVVEKKPEATDPEPIVKYSTEPNYAPVSDRDYRQMTRQKMEDESALNAGAGSLWVMEGQTSYLFAQNKQRRTGDPTRIKIEGAALKQLETKVSTISELLNQLEEQRKQAEIDQKKLEEDKKMDDAKKLRLAEIEKEKDNILTNGLAGTDPTAEAIQKLAEENVNKRMPASIPDTKVKKDEKPVVASQKKEEKPDLKDVEFIPSRIIEKTPEGMYKISGQQMMTIQKRPYKVIATGMVRPEDFDDQSINSGKIFEPQYDIIHIKKTEKQ